MSRELKKRRFRKFLEKNRKIDIELNRMRVWEMIEVSRKIEESEVEQRREHVRRFAEVFETAKTIEMLEKLPAKLGLVSLALGFFAFFSTAFAVKVLFVVILLLLFAAIVLTWIIRRDYRTQLMQQLAFALDFSTRFGTASVNDLAIYNFARAKL